jgi:hypothetical protein
MKKTLFKIMSLALTIGLLASLIIAAVPVSAAVSQPSVALTAHTISSVGNYEIKFDTMFPLAITDTITVTFPVGTTVPAAIAAADVEVSINANAPAPTWTASLGVVTDVTFRTVKVTVPVLTSGPAHMGVRFLLTAAVINPGAPGSYTLTVKTSQETTEVTSLAYTVTVAGNIARYNSSGNFLGNYNTFTLLGANPAAGDTLKVTAGTYEESYNIAAASVTLTSASGVNDVILKGTLTISASGVKVTYITVAGNVAIGMAANVFGVTIDNCTIQRSSPFAPAAVLVADSAPGAFTISNSTVDASGGSLGADTGLSVIGLAANTSAVTVTNVAFKVNQTAAWVPDMAIANNLVGAAGSTLTVSGSTFTGTGGIGYSDAVGTLATTIKANSSFTGLENAVLLNNALAKLTMQDCTVSGSIVNNPAAPAGAIQLTNNSGAAAAPGVLIEGCTIKDNAGYSVNVGAAGNGAGVRVISNNMSGNVKGFNNASAGTVLGVLNYWGAATGPLNAVTNPAGTGDKVSSVVTYKPFVGVMVTAGARSFTATGGADNPDFASAGVSITGYTGVAGAIVNGMKLSTNPKPINPAFPVVQYFDVYTSAASTTAMQLRLYMSTGLTATSQVYFWNTLLNNWVLCSNQGVAGTGDFVFVTINATTTPTFADLVGTPFVIVTGQWPVPPTFQVIAPLSGATTGLINIPVTWNVVVGANKYEVTVSKNGDMSKADVDKFTTGTGYTIISTLDAGVPYFWQVTAWQNDLVVARSNIGMFVPQAPPATTTPTPPVIITSVPAPTITFTNPPSTVITIPPVEVTQITPVWIWGIIGIGAILVIVVIVLIVRTRRTS